MKQCKYEKVVLLQGTVSLPAGVPSVRVRCGSYIIHRKCIFFDIELVLKFTVCSRCQIGVFILHITESTLV